MKGKRENKKNPKQKKGESEMGPNPGLPKNNSNEGAQIKKSGPLWCIRVKFHNDRYAYKTREC